MKKINLRLVILLTLSALFIFVASAAIYQGSFNYQSLFGRGFFPNQVSVQSDITEDVLLERMMVLIPNVVSNLSKMSDQQKRAVIRQVRRDAIAAASASGQGSAQARKFGKVVAAAVSKVLYQPSFGKSYF